MCGIFGFLVNNSEGINHTLIFDNFLKTKGRGPDDCYFNYQQDKYFIGFHRLSINDISINGNQPFEFVNEDRKVTIICNGEIYNSDNLKDNNLSETYVEGVSKKSVRVNNDVYTFKSDSDCEVILPLYLGHGSSFVQYLKGVFAILIIDENLKDNTIKFIVTRDRFGVRPLYIGHSTNGNIMVSSEYKSIYQLCSTCYQFEPGKLSEFKKNNINSEIYYNLQSKISTNFNDVKELIKSKFIESVEKRIANTHRPVCALLSGGLDSSLVCSIASNTLKKKGKTLHTFAIGFEGSSDLIHARSVAEYINSHHKEVVITPEIAINSIKEVIWAIESFDITTVRASVGQYLVSKYISDNTNFKVVLSGDGSDEVCGGYLENYLAPSEKAFQDNVYERIKNIHKYDVQRGDRATSIHGLELRVPFLDHDFVEAYLSAPVTFRMPKLGKQMEKQLLRDIFKGYLPDSVLYRRKEAFSDGISKEDNSWHNIIKNICDDLFDESELNEKISYYKSKPGAVPKCKESLYYRIIFEQLFGDKHTGLIDNFWMQKWSNSQDPSARSLVNIY